MTRQDPRTGRFTAERTTTTITERVTIHHDDTQPISWAPGWDNISAYRVTHQVGRSYREQRAGQVANCLDHLLTWDESAPFDAEVPEVLIREATVILRAGPAATPLELTRGRIA
jgi:hypothetical protein